MQACLFVCSFLLPDSCRLRSEPMSFFQGIKLVMGHGPYAKLVMVFLFTSLGFMVRIESVTHMTVVSKGLFSFYEAEFYLFLVSVSSTVDGMWHYSSLEEWTGVLAMNCCEWGQQQSVTYFINLSEVYTIFIILSLLSGILFQQVIICRPATLVFCNVNGVW